MKYLVLKNIVGGSTEELPFIFPDSLSHADVADALVELSALADAVPLSGGTCTSDMLRPNCHGTTDIVGVTNRGQTDNTLFVSFDETKGTYLTPDE